MFPDLSKLSTEALERELAKRQKVKEISSKLEQYPLQCKDVSYKVVSYSDLEFFIDKLFNRIYNSASVEEMSNDSSKRYNVSGECYGSRKISEVEAYLFHNAEQPPFLSYLLNYLADKNYIEKGEYIVNWSW